MPRTSDVRQRGGAAVKCVRGVERHTEFVVFEAGRDVRVGLGIDVRIHAETHRRPLAEASRHPVQMIEFAGRFDVEAVDRMVERLRHFGVGLADAGKHDPCRIAARRDHARQLAARYDVKPAAEPREQVEHAQIRIGLYRVADEMRDAGERRVELAKRAFKRGARVDEARGSKPCGDVRKRNRLRRRVRRHDTRTPSLLPAVGLHVGHGTIGRLIAFARRWGCGGCARRARLGRRKLQGALDAASAPSQ